MTLPLTRKLDYTTAPCKSQEVFITFLTFLLTEKTVLFASKKLHPEMLVVDVQASDADVGVVFVEHVFFVPLLAIPPTLVYGFGG